VGGRRALRTAAATAPPTATAAELVHGPRLAAAPAGGLVVSGSLVESSENAGGGEDAEIVRKISPPFLFFGLFLFGIFLPEFFFSLCPFCTLLQKTHQYSSKLWQGKYFSTKLHVNIQTLIISIKHKFMIKLFSLGLSQPRLDGRVHSY
jgi:hypothetical protein